MEYEIKLAESQKYIIVKIFNEMTTAKGQATAIESDKLADVYNIKNFLYDVREAPNVESTTTNYNFAYKSMPKFQEKGVRHVAILTSPMDVTHNFLITVMINAGYQVAHFTDENEAIKWLDANQ